MKLLLIALLAQGMFAAGFELDSIRWQNRVIVIFAPALVGERMDAQKRELETDACGVADRDLIVVSAGAGGGTVSGEGSLESREVAELRRRFNVAAGDFVVLLIGKDGGVKLRSERPVSRGEIYQRIDGMPMRRAEMRASRSKGPPPCGEPKRADGL